MMIRATVRENNQQNIMSIRNIGEGYFLHFGIIGHNVFEEFGAFRGEGNNNNLLSENNNGNNLPLLSLLEFKEALKKDLTYRQKAIGFQYSSISKIF